MPGALILTDNLNIAAGTDSGTEELVSDMNNDRVRALLMYNVNPLYDYHDPDKVSVWIEKDRHDR